MFAVLARQAVLPVFGNGFELIEFVLPKAFDTQSAYSERKTGREKGREDEPQGDPILCKKELFRKLVRSYPGSRGRKRSLSQNRQTPVQIFGIK